MECCVCEQDFPESEMEEHHVMYSPEVTVNVCISCHNTIHADNGRLEELDPRESGAKWVGSKHADWNESE